MQKGQQMLARCPKSAETNIDQDINNLKEKWESVETKLNERKVCALINMIHCFSCFVSWVFTLSLCNMISGMFNDPHLNSFCIH